MSFASLPLYLATLCADAGLAALGTAAALAVHDPGLSGTRINVDGDRIAVVAAFHATDVLGLAPTDANGDRRIDADELARGSDALLAAFGGVFELAGDGALLSPVAARTQLGENADVEFWLTYARGTAMTLRWQVRFDALPRGHRQHVAVFDAEQFVGGKVLSAAEPAFERALASSTAPAPTWPAFLMLGLEHILVGYDHILFLLALLLTTTRLSHAAVIVTSFTLAHSLTLALATFDVVRLPGSLVEATIAASIVFVAVENLIVTRPRHRWRVTFLFGLIHGFGFASVLQSLGIAESGGVVVPLLAFNLGVELGQLAIAAAALPLLAWLRRTRAWRQIGPALSAMIAGAGAWWLIERTLLG